MKKDFQPIDLDAFHAGSGLTPYKVRTGDTMASLAERYGCTKEELAILNFGTDDAEEVQFYLENCVGCTQKSEDGLIFSESDEPGILRVPTLIDPVTEPATRQRIYVRRHEAG